MKERPILFSAAMVRAILAGTKTQTRRVLRVQPPRWCTTFGWSALTPPGMVEGRGRYVDEQGVDHGPASKFIPVPYAVGDRLWGKEAIRHIGDGRSEYIADGSLTVADAWPWKNKALPGMYCPRGLSRIKGPVTAIRVQWLQDISAEDSLAEGVPRASVCGCEVCRRSVQMCPADASEQVMAYAALWDSINRKRPGCSWDANPCVVAVTFNPEAQTP